MQVLAFTFTSIQGRVGINEIIFKIEIKMMRIAA